MLICRICLNNIICSTNYLLLLIQELVQLLVSFLLLPFENRCSDLPLASPLYQLYQGCFIPSLLGLISSNICLGINFSWQGSFQLPQPKPLPFFLNMKLILLCFWSKKDVFQSSPPSHLFFLTFFFFFFIFLFFPFVVDKNRLTIDRTHHKRLEALPGWYLSEYTRERIPFRLGVLVWCRLKTLKRENQ